MKYYMAEKHFVSRGDGYIPLEDIELRIDRKEISAVAYEVLMESLIDVKAVFTNKDGSVTYAYSNNSNESTEITIWVEDEKEPTGEKKRRLAIEGYTISIPSKGYYTIMVLRNDNCVTEFEELNSAQMPVLISAFEADDSIEAYVVADSHGPYDPDVNTKTVYFIGSGYEAVDYVRVLAETPREAMEKAEKFYNENGWTFHYCELEVDKYEW